MTPGRTTPMRRNLPLRFVCLSSLEHSWVELRYPSTQDLFVCVSRRCVPVMATARWGLYSGQASRAQDISVS